VLLVQEIEKVVNVMNENENENENEKLKRYL